MAAWAWEGGRSMGCRAPLAAGRHEGGNGHGGWHPEPGGAGATNWALTHAPRSATGRQKLPLV